MNYSLRLAISAFFICGAFALAQSNASSTGQTQEPPAPRSNAREPHAATAPLAGIDVLSDTTGVDISSYLQSAVKTVKQDWHDVIPPSARAPKTMRGEVTIEFAILKTGKVAGMRLVHSSSDVPLDRAAWAAIYNSKLSPLPAEYAGKYLALRFHFVYNPVEPSDAALQYHEGAQP